MEAKNLRSGNWLYLVLPVVFLLNSCGTNNRTKEAQRWINDRPKPIIVFSHKMNSWTMNHNYTFIDNAGVVYITGEIKGTFPDTIKQFKTNDMYFTKKELIQLLRYCKKDRDNTSVNTDHFNFLTNLMDKLKIKLKNTDNVKKRNENQVNSKKFNCPTISNVSELPKNNNCKEIPPYFPPIPIKMTVLDDGRMFMVFNGVEYDLIPRGL